MFHRILVLFGTTLLLVILVLLATILLLVLLVITVLIASSLLLLGVGTLTVFFEQTTELYKVINSKHHLEQNIK